MGERIRCGRSAGLKKKLHNQYYIHDMRIVAIQGIPDGFIVVE